MSSSNMRDILRFLHSIPRTVQVIGIGALCVWIFKAIWLDEKPAPFQFIYDLSHVVEGLLAAVISGYVFYIIFALWPDFQSRRTLAPFIYGKVRGIVGDCMGILEQINRSSGRQIGFWEANEASIVDAFAAIPFNSNPNTQNIVGGVFVTSTWFQFFAYREARTRKSISDLFTQGRFLDAEVVSILTEIADSTFFMQNVGVENMPISNPNLGAWGGGYMVYIDSCRKLADWHDRNCPSGTNPIRQLA